MATELQSNPQSLAGRRVALIGRLAGMSKRDAQQLIRQHGGATLENGDPAAELLVVGEADPPLEAEQFLDPATRAAVERGEAEIITESQLWERLGFVEGHQNVHRLYTPRMLAEMLRVPLAIIRRWHRRGLIVPVRQVRRLPYFDFQEVATARQLAEMLAAGLSPDAIEKKLAELGRFLPNVERPLAQLSIIVQGKNLLLRQGEGLLAPGGQLWFDFEAEPESSEDAADASAAADAPPTPKELLAAAAELEDEEKLEEAAEMYRAAMSAGGPSAEGCFMLAELLYRLGDTAGARERYYMAVELDEDYVEARANLGCVLAELGQADLAQAALEGALAYHPDYPDAHYHLARLLDEAERGQEAQTHWQAFLSLAPQSPWADEARSQLGLGGEQALSGPTGQSK